VADSRIVPSLRRVAVADLQPGDRLLVARHREVVEVRPSPGLQGNGSDDFVVVVSRDVHDGELYEQAYFADEKRRVLRPVAK
jgi:hypothetical protein